jgi:TetR/AcrR family transcriptional regulator, transcriptional repressor of bet genes
MARTRATEEVRRQQILQAAFEVASREGIAGLTVRAVAGEASLSHALVLFHFKRKDRLVLELLDWLIERMAVPALTPEIARLPIGLDRLHALLQREMTRLTREPRHTRLFLEFWALGARQEPIRLRISAELERYRAAFRGIIEELASSEPAAFAGMTPDGLAAVAVSWIHGFAVQAMSDPDRFDVDDYIAAVRGLVGQIGGTKRES